MFGNQKANSKLLQEQLEETQRQLSDETIKRLKSGIVMHENISIEMKNELAMVENITSLQVRNRALERQVEERDEKIKELSRGKHAKENLIDM